MKSTDKILLIACVLIATGILAFAFRFQAINDSGQGFYLLNRWSGQIYSVRLRGGQPVFTEVLKVETTARTENTQKFDVDGARKAGYSNEEIIERLLEDRDK